MNKKWILIMLVLMSFLVCGCAALDSFVTALVGADEQTEDGEATGILNAQTVKGVVSHTAWGPTALAGLVALLGFYKKYRKNKQLSSGIAGVQTIKNTLADWIKGFQAEKKRLPTLTEITAFVNDVMQAKANLYGVAKEMKKDVRTLKDIAKETDIAKPATT